MNNSIFDVDAMLEESMQDEISRLERLNRKSEKELAEHGKFLDETEGKLQNYLAGMEALGIRVDDEKMRKAEAGAKAEAEQIIREIEKSATVSDNPPVTYSELVSMAHSQGFENTKVQDLLTEEEISDADRRFAEMDAEFGRKTKLNKTDVAFLIIAVALQVVRQYVLTPFSKRGTAKEGAAIMEEKYGNKKDLHGKYYYAPEDTITKQESVPFDIIAGSRNYGLGGEEGKGLSGDSHRFRSLGHDPILGYVFGTANIMTNTATWWNGTSHHIRYGARNDGVKIPKIAAHADTGKVFAAVDKRFHGKDGKRILIEALIKEHIHLKSDKTTDGLPLPFLQTISPDMAQDLAELGLDSVALGDAAKQLAFAELINFLISAVHGFGCREKGKEGRRLYAVRTKKIILLSSSIATTSNLIAVGVGSVAGNMTGNAKLVEDSLRNLDVGGILSTIAHLFSDIHFIVKVKEEFIQSRIDDMLKEQLDDLDRELSAYN